MQLSVQSEFFISHNYEWYTYVSGFHVFGNIVPVFAINMYFTSVSTDIFTKKKIKKK